MAEKTRIAVAKCCGGRLWHDNGDPNPDAENSYANSQLRQGLLLSPDAFLDHDCAFPLRVPAWAKAPIPRAVAPVAPVAPTEAA